VLFSSAANQRQQDYQDQRDRKRTQNKLQNVCHFDALRPLFDRAGHSHAAARVVLPTATLARAILSQAGTVKKPSNPAAFVIVAGRRRLLATGIF
jgi:hypothetical protein